MYIYSHNDNKRKNGLKLFFTVLVTMLFTVIIIENIIILTNGERKTFMTERLASYSEYSNNSNTHNEYETSQIIESVKKSTVGISLLKPSGSSLLDVNATEKWGMGTGIIVTKNGYVLTNQHLAQNVRCKINNHTKWWKRNAGKSGLEWEKYRFSIDKNRRKKS